MSYTNGLDKPTDYFETLIWTGNGSTPRTISGLDFAPNMIWSKRRDDAAGHNLLDSVRGAGANSELCPSSTGVEGANAAETYGYLSAFTSDGFTVTAGSSDNAYWNNNTATYVAWNWKAGTSFTNDASSTGIGTIDSTGSANDTAGFSIVSYVGTGSAGTIKHGLSSAPSVVLIKNRSTNGKSWIMAHKSIGFANGIYLNLTDASASETSAFNSTAPTASVFTVGNTSLVNDSGDNYIAYCFADVKGYSKVSGSYVGNGNANGSYIHLGFSPAWLMIKRSDAGTDRWTIIDNKRSVFNVANQALYADDSQAETTSTSEQGLDMLSNGFKIRNSNTKQNTSGSTYIYMAFAEAPFVTSSGVPTTAR